MPPLVPKTTDQGRRRADDRLRAQRGDQPRGKQISLTPTEHRLLYHLVSNPGRVLTYETLLAKVWGYEYREEAHYVRLYVNYLRQKIEPDPSHPKYVLTERGLGYRFHRLQAAAGDNMSRLTIGEAIQQVVGVLSNVADTDEVLQTVATAARQMMQADEGYLLIREGGRLVLRAADGLPRHLVGRSSVRIGEGSRGLGRRSRRDSRPDGCQPRTPVQRPPWT